MSSASPLPLAVPRQTRRRLWTAAARSPIEFTAAAAVAAHGVIDRAKGCRDLLPLHEFSSKAAAHGVA